MSRTDTIDDKPVILTMSQLTDDFFDDLVDLPEVGMVLIGPPGMGKSARIHQYAASRNIPMVVEYLATIDAPDWRGFAVPTKDEDGRSVTRYTMPPVLTRINAAIKASGSDRGILFLDELFQSDHLVQKAVAPVFSEHLIGEQPLPGGWAVWGASNRESDRAGVARILSHFQNRVSTLHVTPDPQALVAHFEGKGMHPICSAFVKFNPQAVITEEVPAKPGPYPTPRSYERAVAFLTKRAKGSMHLPTDASTHAVVAGYIGRASAAELMAFADMANELPTNEEIIARPDSCKLPNIKRIDAQYAAMRQAVNLATPNNVDNVWVFIERLNEDMHTAAAESLCKQHNSGLVLNSRNLNRWLMNHSSLVTGILGR